MVTLLVAQCVSFLATHLFPLVIEELIINLAFLYK